MEAPRRRHAWLAVALLLGVACAGRVVPTQEYVLSSLDANEGESADAGAGGESGPVISVGPVLLPAYLRRRQIVTRTSDHRVKASERHQWAEELDAGVTRCLAENLARLIPSDRVARFPWPAPAPPTYRVTVEFERFERQADSVVLKARWALSGRRSGDGLGSGRAVHRVPVEDDDYSATVDAMGRALVEMSRTLADVIRSHHAGEPAQASRASLGSGS